MKRDRAPERGETRRATENVLPGQLIVIIREADCKNHGESFLPRSFGAGCVYQAR